MLCFCFFRNLRKSQPRKVIIQLSTSLLCLYLTFIILFAIDTHHSYVDSYDSNCKSDATVGCITLAAVLHYFTLTTVMWMGVEARMLYNYIVVIFDTKKGHLTLAGIIAWGKCKTNMTFIFILKPLSTYF